MAGLDLEQYFRSVLDDRPQLPPPMNTTFQLPKSIKVHDDIFVKMVNWDVQQQQSLLLGLTNNSVVPLHVSGQGFCVLPAISKCLWGTEVYAKFLHLKLIEEIKQNSSWYLSLTSPEEYHVHLQELNDGTKLRFFHILALSNVLGRVILVYAPPELVAQYGEGHGGVAASFLPTRLGHSQCVEFPIGLAVSPSPKLVYIPLVPYEGSSFSWPIIPPAFPSSLRSDESTSDYFRSGSPVVLRPPPMQLVIENRERLAEYAARRQAWGKANPESYISTVRELKTKYDLVWQVEMGGGEQRFICYNVGDDPEALARKFAAVEHLPEQQHKQILQFILAQIARAKQDPSTFHMFAPGYNRKKAKPPMCQHFPYMGDMVSYSQAKFPLMLKKITEFNTQLKKNSNGDITKYLVLSDPEIVKLTSIVSKLEIGIDGVSNTTLNNSLTVDDFAVLKKLLTWPNENLFPVLDLIRMVADNTQCIGYLQANTSLITQILLIGKALNFTLPPTTPTTPNTNNNSTTSSNSSVSNNATSTPTNPSSVTNMFLILKTIVNFLRKDAKRVMVRTLHTDLFDVFGVASNVNDKNVCSALASAMLNYSLLEREARQFSDPWATVILRTLHHTEDPDSAFKFLVALGSLLVKEYEYRHHLVNLPSRDQFDFVWKKFSNFSLGQNGVGAEKIQQCVADLKMLLLTEETVQ